MTIVVDDKNYSPVPIMHLDANGDVIMTPELESELSLAEAEADRGEGIPWSVARDQIFGKR